MTIWTLVLCVSMWSTLNSYFTELEKYVYSVYEDCRVQ